MQGGAVINDPVLNSSLGSLEFIRYHARGTFDTTLILAMPIDWSAVAEVNNATSEAGGCAGVPKTF